MIEQNELLRMSFSNFEHLLKNVGQLLKKTCFFAIVFKRSKLFFAEQGYTSATTKSVSSYHSILFTEGDMDRIT